MSETSKPENLQRGQPKHAQNSFELCRIELNSLKPVVSGEICKKTYVYMYVHIYIYVYIHTYIYIYNMYVHACVCVGVFCATCDPETLKP